jgi:hypothetical protein
MSAIEGAMIEALAPMARRLGIDPARTAAIRDEGRTEAEAMETLGWPEILNRMCLDYPVFVAEFEAVANAATYEDQEGARLLLDHEVALLDYARAAKEGRSDTLLILESFLKRLRGYRALRRQPDDACLRATRQSFRQSSPKGT